MSDRSRLAKYCIPALAACFMAWGTTLNAQPPRQQSRASTRARQACDAAASRYGYHVMRRDQETANGSSYDLPLHVSHGSTEADVTCTYDSQRGVASIPAWDPRNNRAFERGQDIQQAQGLCENYVNNRKGYQVVQVGTPTRHGRDLYDVPVTVRRSSRRATSVVTCRYNAASNKLSLR